MKNILGTGCLGYAASKADSFRIRKCLYPERGMYVEGNFYKKRVNNRNSCFQHEEKMLLLSCIVIDIVFLFAWIILWLILTLKRDWNFKVVHQVHEIIALQVMN